MQMKNVALRQVGKGIGDTRSSEGRKATIPGAKKGVATQGRAAGEMNANGRCKKNASEAMGGKYRSPEQAE